MPDTNLALIRYVLIASWITSKGRRQIGILTSAGNLIVGNCRRRARPP